MATEGESPSLLPIVDLPVAASNDAVLCENDDVVHDKRHGASSCRVGLDDDDKDNDASDPRPQEADTSLSQDVGVTTAADPSLSENVDDDDNVAKTTCALSCPPSPRCLIAMIMLCLIGYVIVDAFTTGHVRDGVNACLDWIEDNPILGFFLFALVYAIATVLFIPGSLLTLGAGLVFTVAFDSLGLGVAIGSLAVFVGASVGAIGSFILARYLLQTSAAQLATKYAVFEAVNVALRDNGLYIFTLLRLSPIIPFNAINYLGGVSSISLRNYSLALIAILPGTVLYVFLGASAGSLADSASNRESKQERMTNPTITIVVIVVGIVFGVLAIAVTTRYARKELNRVLEKREQEQTATPTSDNAVAMALGAADSNEIALAAHHGDTDTIDIESARLER